MKTSHRVCTYLASLQQTNIIQVIWPNILTQSWLPASHAGVYCSQLLRGIAARIACRMRRIVAYHPPPWTKRPSSCQMTCRWLKPEARSLRPTTLVQHQTQGRCILQPTQSSTQFSLVERQINLFN